MAIAFCNKLSKMTGKDLCYTISTVSDWDNVTIPTDSDADWNAVTCDWSKNGYRLPTELEWECAARGGKIGDTTNWNYQFSGSDTIGDVAWNNANAGDYLHPMQVGLKQPNILFIYDMTGNVREWCWNLCDSQDKVQPETSLYGLETNSNNYHQIRGGCFSNYESYSYVY